MKPRRPSSLSQDRAPALRTGFTLIELLVAPAMTALWEYHWYPHAWAAGTVNGALPVINWTPTQTNSFDASGNFSFTNAISPAVPRLFYLLRVP